MKAVQRYQKQVEEENLRIEDESPLFKLFLVEQFPPKFKLPILDKYVGTTDLRSHVVNFLTTMML